MKISIFDKILNLKDHYCSLDDYEPLKIEKPYINLYIQPTLTCNANCSFCIFKCNQDDFFFDKLIYCFIELQSKNIQVRRVNITGGEPSLRLNRLNKITKIVREFEPNCFLGVNSNGSKIDELMNISDNINTVTISRHHYNDKINSEILGINSPTLEHLSQYKDKIHLSCNLIKGYIYNKITVKRYFEECLKYGLKDVGFVGLMKLNKFCEDHYIDFRDIFNDENVIQLKEWNNGTSCRCRNYAYISEEQEDYVEFYARHYCKSNNNENTLVFNGKNLTIGFDKNKIII